MLQFASNEVAVLPQVVMIDLVLAGDNAIVIGLAAAGLPLQQRTNAVLLGIIAATVLRITFAAVTTQLLQVVGLVLADGILLLWVSWKMFRELRLSTDRKQDAIETMVSIDINADGAMRVIPAEVACSGRKSDRCRGRINVPTTSWPLPVPRERISPFLIIGLGLSVALMGVAARYIARRLHRHQWIAYAGLFVILYVAVEMIYRGMDEVRP